MLYIKNISGSNLTLEDMRLMDMEPDVVIEITQNWEKHEISNSSSLIENVSNGNLEVKDGFEKVLSRAEAIKAFSGEITPTEMDNIGRWYVRTDSRPKEWDIVFAGAGDDVANKVIGGGKEFVWDFSNSDDLDWDAPEGYKRKIITWQFLDSVRIKEGTMYFYDAPKNCWVDMYVVCPTGGYYKKKTIDVEGNLQSEIIQASKSIKFIHWVNKYHICGTTPMGDELNTESADDDESPSYLIFQCEVTTKNDDTTSHGHFSLELYRPRTIHFEAV